MELDSARAIAGRFVELIAPKCEQVLIVGSIRRKRPEVGDIDIVAIPRTAYDVEESWFTSERREVNLLAERLNELVREGAIKPRVKKDGKTMVGERVAMLEYEGFPVDIYYATTETWGGLVLVRTGSVEHNIVLTRRAIEKGWKLHADGTGVWDARVGGKRVDDGSEPGIFAVLDLPYRKPEDREVSP